MVSLVAFANELEKGAARAGLKIIRRLLHGAEPAAANLAKAERLAVTPGVLKKTRQGSQIRELGGGAEGVATLVAHPKKGITVRKLYDPAGPHAAGSGPVGEVSTRAAKLNAKGSAVRSSTSGGIASPKLIARKEQFAKEMQGASGLPQFHGSATTTSGKPMHFSEYVPGKTYGKRFEEAIKSIEKKRSPLPNREIEKLEGLDEGGPAMRRLQLQAKHRGYELQDLHNENIQLTRGKKGKLEPKAIDVVPARPGEAVEDLIDTGRLDEMKAEAKRGHDPHGADRTRRLMREAFSRQRGGLVE